MRRGDIDVEQPKEGKKKGDGSVREMREKRILEREALASL